MHFIHTLLHGGVLGSVKPQSVNYFLAWFLEITAYCAVDCYALISGYVGVAARYRMSNFVYLWLQTFMYSVLFLIIFSIVDHNMFTAGTFFKYALPTTYAQHWYFSAYAGLFLLMPFLNYSLNNLQKNLVKWCVIIAVVSITVFSRMNENFLYLSGGYTGFWLIILYVLGGYIRKYESFKTVKKCWLLIIWAAGVVVSWATKLILELAFSKEKGNFFVSYLSPTVIAVAVVMLELFSRKENVGNKFLRKAVEISTFSSFGVYLIHTNFFVWHRFLENKFAPYSDYNPVLLFLAVIGTALVIFVICSVIDYLRHLFFELIKIRKCLLHLEDKFKNKYLKEDEKVENTEIK